MLRQFLAVHDGFAVRGDRVRVVKRDAQRVHVRFLLRIDATGRVEIKRDGLRVRRFELHAGTIAQNAIVRHRELAILLVIHRDHFLRRAGEATFLQHRAARDEPVIQFDVHRALAHVRLAGPRTDERLHALEFGRRGLGSFGLGGIRGAEPERRREQQCGAEGGDVCLHDLSWLSVSFIVNATS